MAPLPVTLNDIGVTCTVWKLYKSQTSVNLLCIIYYIFTDKSEVAYTFNCIFEHEGFLKVTSNHIHCKYGNISETVQDEVVVITDH